jgi:tetratricopeptide (TPR) repeat protein
MMATPELRPALRKLAAEPAAATNPRLWRALTADERKQALLALLGDQDDRLENRPKLVAAIARDRHFRPQTVESWNDEKLATWASRLETLENTQAGAAIIAWHLRDRVDLLSAFLDRLGIPHHGGRIPNERVPATPFAASAIAGAADQLLESHEVDHLAVYLLALRVNSPSAFATVDGWLRERARGDIEVVTPTTDEPDSPSSVSDATEFTTLDRRLIQMVVDASAGIVGAACEDEVDDLLLEIEQLNATRHVTFFHRGFRDSLFGRPPVDALPAENESRRRWYWSGYVTGLTRRDDWPRIAELFGAQSTVRELGTRGDGPASCAAVLVFQALARADRFGEAAAFARQPAVEASAALRAAMLTTATELLRNSRANEARTLLDGLWEVVGHAAEEIEEQEARFAIDVRRRRALCLRQLGERDEALAILRELARSTDTVVRAIAHTDIGLIQAGYRRLGDMALPKEREDLPSLIAALERGEDKWTTATKTKGFSPAHANFALGVLALAREKYDEADHRLGAAVTIFGGKPEVYAVDGSLGLAQLYHGIAICLTLQDPGRLVHARELIVAGLKKGARIPRWLAGPTVEALAMQNGDVAREAAAAILQHSDDEFLDELVGSSSHDVIPALRPALFRRAASPSRSNCQRAVDYRVVLPWLLEAQEIAKARDALEFLEERAFDGSGRTEFLDLLTRPESLSPAWDEERCRDARVRMLELAGRFVEVAAAVEAEAYRLLALDDVVTIDTVELLLLELERFGPAGTECISRLQPIIDGRLAARARAEAELMAGSAGILGDENIHVRILVVGGNEVQARMDESIRATIRDAAPGVTIEFLHSGWSGNWAAHADQFDRDAAKADGVVFLQLMRTMFGRTIRARCHVPWRGCRGRGQGEIVNAIKRVVPVVRANLRCPSPLASPAR